MMTRMMTRIVQHAGRNLTRAQPGSQRWAQVRVPVQGQVRVPVQLQLPRLVHCWLLRFQPLKDGLHLIRCREHAASAATVCRWRHQLHQPSPAHCFSHGQAHLLQQ